MDDETYDELVQSVTPRETVAGVKTYQNTVAMACPACEEPFDDLVVCENEYNSLELSKMLDLCVTTHEGDVLLFTHKP
ncbi:DUF7385 family protein [Haloarchaeobius sp. HME9146]|uniref:DUF7385 family protein n=1 Tax=unclassified Haloarchaeobius TaxID=2614452 RepID=UPI0021C0A49C|nr:hypothetical protein [Haloarchaeobius sp. HME9146]MCT9096392.1 hypothetical protein [Haloarchaeobius sp. HME9146]